MKAREKTTGGIIYGAVEYQSNTAEWRVKGRNIIGGYVDCPASDVVMLWNEPDMFFGKSIETQGKCAFPVAVQPGYAATGLSRREFFASLAMQGIISGRDAFAIGTAIPDFSKQVAKSAVIFADDLIAELNKKGEGELDCANALLGNTPNCNNVRKKTVATKFLRQILPPNAVLDYLDDVWDSEECENDPLDAILNNAWWWHSGGKNRQYHVDAMPVGDVADDIYCVIYKDDKEIGNLTLAFDDAISIGLWNGEEGKK